MSNARQGSGSGGSAGAQDGAETVTESALFSIAWEALAEVLGSAATAAIVRRAVGRTLTRHPELAELVITRGDLEYRYTLPEAWSQNGDRQPLALRGLAMEIGSLLQELTGTVVILRLEEINELRAHGLVWRTGEAN